MLKNRLANTFLGILVSSLFISCASTPITHIPGYTTVRFFDLTKYTELGFLITPEETYAGKYDSIGSLTIEKMPEAKKVEVGQVTRKKEKDDWMFERGARSGSQVTRKKWVIETIMGKDIEATMDKLYQRAKESGADAMVNFRIEEVTRERIVDFKEMETIVLVGIRVSGFAIKRLD